jgi:dTDP-4-amino-4,6-dideoxygalactose transaminase
MTASTNDRHHGRALSYDVVCAGFNYRLDEIRAALLRAQLRKLPEFLCRRRELFTRYAERLHDTPVHLPFADTRIEEELEQTAVHILPVLLPPGVDRQDVMVRLRERGIQTSIHYPPVHSFSAYRDQGCQLPRTEELAGRELTLPLYPEMTPSDVDIVVEALLDSLPPTCDKPLCVPLKDC